MGKVLERFIKKELINKPTIGRFSLEIEYYSYMDKEEKIINRNHYSFIGYLMSDPVKLYLSKQCILFDQMNRKIVSITLNPDSKIESLRAAVIITFILQSIDKINELLQELYANGVDRVPDIAITVDDTTLDNPSYAYDKWMDTVIRHYGLRKEQCHNIVLSETLTPDELMNPKLVDFRIIRSQREDITLVRKF